MMKLVRGYWTDGNNRWSVHKHTMGGAACASYKMSNCTGCTDCIECADCVDCTDCRGCTKCTTCTGCSSLHACSYCTNCLRCYECEGCYGCLDCTECNSCGTKSSAPILGCFKLYNFRTNPSVYRHPVLCPYGQQPTVYWTKSRIQYVIAGEICSSATAIRQKVNSYFDNVDDYEDFIGIAQELVKQSREMAKKANKREKTR